EEVLLEALAVVAEVDLGPEAVVEEQKGLAVFLAVGGGTGGLGGAVFEDDLRLREMAGDGGGPAPQDEGGVGDAVAIDQRAILQDLPVRHGGEAGIPGFLLPAFAELGDGLRLEGGEIRTGNRLGGEIGAGLGEDFPQLVIVEGDESVARALEV